MAVHVAGVGAIAVEPIAHQRRVEAALDFADKAIADVEAHLVLHIAAIGQDDDVAGRAAPRCRWPMPSLGKVCTCPAPQ